MSDLVMLKLGGSLITEKSLAHTVRADVLSRLAHEIQHVYQSQPGLRLVLGHGSGSFGHMAAQKYNTRQGVSSPSEWRGFVEVWQEANALNRLVMDALFRVGLPAIALPASSAVTAQNGRVKHWDLTPIQMALDSGLLPVVYGDVIFDLERGGTIFSTEDLFAHLARNLHPSLILLAGIEAGVWADFPTNTRLIEAITPQNLTQISAVLGGSSAVDVTGGMQSKVYEMLALVKDDPELAVRIFSGLQPGLVEQALQGEAVGTSIYALTSPTT
jgi:isopentenyl phosphate kinase